MYAQPMLTNELASTRIAEIRESAGRTAHRSRSLGDRRVERRAISAPLPARRRAGWWLVTIGLRLAVGPAQPVRSAGAR